jgi:hypothetical protein
MGIPENIAFRIIPVILNKNLQAPKAPGGVLLFDYNTAVDRSLIRDDLDVVFLEDIPFGFFPDRTWS